jgi:hypothetical protein
VETVEGVGTASSDAGIYRTLSPARIIETVDRLSRRVHERFPQSDLSRVSDELLAVARAAAQRAETFARPLLVLRVGVGAVVAVIIVGTCAAAWWVAAQNGPTTWAEFAQGADAGLNVAILAGAAVFSLVTGETRIKRRRALKAIHELRVLAHVVELHQLTKDPDRLLYPSYTTASSPPLAMTTFELTRYLDYCSEMLALIANLAALYAQQLDDPVVLGAVDAIASLTGGISAKIWQKLVIINTAAAFRVGD